MRVHAFAVTSLLVALLPTVLGASRDRLRCQLAIQPGGTISVDNTQSNQAATGSVVDESGWSTVVVRLQNDHSFWLKEEEHRKWENSGAFRGRDRVQVGVWPIRMAHARRP